MKNLTQIFKLVEKFTADNSPVILTAIGVAGTISTAILTGKASVKAVDLLREVEATDASVLWDDADTPPTIFRKARVVWKFYIPPVSVAAVTVTAIILANRIGTRRSAALAAAYTTLDQSFGEYKVKMVEKLGESKERTARDEIAQQRATNNPPANGSVYVTKKGLHPTFDNFSGRWFESSMQDMLNAQNRINYILVSGDGYASVNQFYDRLGLPTVEMGEEFGWTSDDQLELMITSTVTDGDEPGFHLEFRSKPIRGYHRARR